MRNTHAITTPLYVVGIIGILTVKVPEGVHPMYFWMICISAAVLFFSTLTVLIGPKTWRLNAWCGGVAALLGILLAKGGSYLLGL